METTQPSTLGERRIYRTELLEQLGISLTWWKHVRARDALPPGRHDVRGKRIWFYESEARDILTKLTGNATGASTSTSSTTPSL